MGVLGNKPQPIGMALVDNMLHLTSERTTGQGLNNAERNQQFFRYGRSLADLRNQPLADGDQCIVIAAGPSIKRQDPLSMLKKTNYKGAIISTDSALFYCLRNHVVPDLVVTLDPHAKRIVRWFGDPHLTEEDIIADDYFSRQDMDEAFANELQVNDEILTLLDKYGKDINIALSTSASNAVVKRAIDSKMKIYWWNPMYDDPDQENSITRALYKKNQLPCVNAGGNVGTACWMMGHAVLNKRQVAFTGMDFGYYEGTPYEKTQYYKEAAALFGQAQLKDYFIRVFNPHEDQWFYSDPAYMWYRQCLFDLLPDANCVTYNCTEGGIVFGEGVQYMPLVDFLSSTST